MNELRMELKVCEGCGVLWVRSGRDGTVYCRGCAEKLADFPAAIGRRLPRGPRRRRVDSAVVRASGLRVVGGSAARTATGSAATGFAATGLAATKGQATRMTVAGGARGAQR